MIRLKDREKSIKKKREKSGLVADVLTSVGKQWGLLRPNKPLVTRRTIRSSSSSLAKCVDDRVCVCVCGRPHTAVANQWSLLTPADLEINTD